MKMVWEPFEWIELTFEGMVLAAAVLNEACSSHGDAAKIGEGVVADDQRHGNEEPDETVEDVGNLKDTHVERQSFFHLKTQWKTP